MVPVGIEERILRRSPPTPAKAVILAVLISGSIKSHITIAFAECGRHTIATTQTQGGPDEGRIHASFANENTDPQSETEELYDLLCGHSQPGAFLQCVVRRSLPAYDTLCTLLHVVHTPIRDVPIL